MSRGRVQAGYTFLEMMVVVAAASLLYLLFVETLSSSSSLARTSRADLQANDDARRSLDVLANTLRGAAWTSLDGFDADDVATQPSFQRVAGSDANGAVLDVVETLRWRATASVDGIVGAGEVVLEKAGAVTVLAPRVPGGGFRVERSGNTLRIFLTTYASTSQRVVTQAAAEALVALRN
jgi:prepilin-type N-terminal cleavage/methylation domain-containing protein